MTVKQIRITEEEHKGDVYFAVRFDDNIWYAQQIKMNNFRKYCVTNLNTILGADFKGQLFSDYEIAREHAYDSCKTFAQGAAKGGDDLPPMPLVDETVYAT